jgi:hypothetical protein
MKAEITEDGILLVTAETSTERYALKRWRDHSKIFEGEHAKTPRSGIAVNFEDNKTYQSS